MCGNRRICFHSDVKYNNPIISAVCIQGVMKSSFNVFAYLWSLNRHVASFFQLGGGGGGGGSSRLIQNFLTSEKRTSFINQKKPYPRRGEGKPTRTSISMPATPSCLMLLACKAVTVQQYKCLLMRQSSKKIQQFNSSKLECLST